MTLKGNAPWDSSKNSAWDWLMNNLTPTGGDSSLFRSVPGRVYSPAAYAVPRSVLSPNIINYWILASSNLEPGDGTARYTYWQVPYDMNIVSVNIYRGLISPGITSGALFLRFGDRFNPMPWVELAHQYCFNSASTTAVSEIDALRTITFPQDGIPVRLGDQLYFRRSLSPKAGAGNWQPACMIFTRQRSMVAL